MYRDPHDLDAAFWAASIIIITWIVCVVGIVTGAGLGVIHFN